MKFMQHQRAETEALLPGLDDELARFSLAELEERGNPALALFRKAGGTGLLVPRLHGGAGATPRQALACTRALGARSPSLAVATMMHHFSVASLVAVIEHSTGMEWMLLDAIANDRLLVASGFAEGRTGQGILAPTLTARRDGNGYRLTGSKKPCSLARSMDLLTASVWLPADGGATAGVGVALVPARTQGISVREFWGSSVLTGAESDEVILEDVPVPPEMMLRIELDLGTLDDLQTVGFLWFELLVGAAYLGVVSALVERVLGAGRGPVEARAELVVLLEGAQLALDNVAMDLETGVANNEALGRALVARYTCQHLIQRALPLAVELLGGMAFISSSEVAYLAAAAHAIAFHPPARNSAAAALLDFYAGLPLSIP